MPLMSKKRQFFSVTSSLQYRFLAMTLTYGFLIVSFFIGAVMGPDISEMRDQNLSPELRSSAAHRVLDKNSWIWPASLALIALLGVHSFLKFQKVMGPLYRFQWAFRQLEKGRLLSAVTTRDKDYLKDELETLNQMIKVLRHNIRAIKKESEAALTSIADLDRLLTSSGNLSPEQLKLLEAHRQQIDELANAVRFFQLQDEPQETVQIRQEALETCNPSVKETANGISEPTNG